MPAIEDLPPRSTPAKPPVEEFPARRSPPIVLGGAKDRKPISGGGASFFDPGKLSGDALTGTVDMGEYRGATFTARKHKFA